jgi:HSP20 family protein
MANKSIVSRNPSEIEPRRMEGDPFLAMQRRMNRLFEEFMGEPMSMQPFDALGGTFSPRVDVVEDDKEIRVTAELPGMDAKDIDISLHRDVLALRGEKSSEKQEKSGQYQRIERSYGSFERQIPLGVEVDADKVEAEYKNGVLTVTVPRPDEKMAKTRKIDVKKA